MFKRRVPRRVAPVTRGDTKVWIDDLEVGIEDRNAAGQRVIATLDKCTASPRTGVAAGT